MFNIIFLKVVVACSFWVARVITRRKSFELNWPEVPLKEKYIAWATRVPYNKLLTNLAYRAVQGNIGPRSFLCGLRDGRSVLSRPRANIPQYGPRARLILQRLIWPTFSKIHWFSPLEFLAYKYKNSTSLRIFRKTLKNSMLNCYSI